MNDEQTRELLALLRDIGDSLWEIRDTLVVKLSEGERNELTRRVKRRTQQRQNG